jgi:tetratricopeptide (TPR) repeat protein
MTWFERAMALNPYDPYSAMRYGMCLDWLDKRAEAAKYFEKARQLAPNDHFVWTYSGWHEMQVGNWKEAKRMLEYALSFYYTETAVAYLELANKRINEPSMLKY